MWEIFMQYCTTDDNIQYTAYGVRYGSFCIADLCADPGKIAHFAQLGHRVPTRDLIKTPDQIAGIKESAKIIQQAMDNMPDGPFMAKVPKMFKPPKGEAYHRVENTLGELGFYIVSDGTTKPYRVHIRRPSFINLQALDHMCKGMLLADAVTAFATIDPLMGEVDC